MLRQYHSELGDKARENSIIAIYGALTGKYMLYSNMELSGQGIKLKDPTGQENWLNRPSYIVTIKAFEKICKKYDIDQNLLFD